MVPPGIAPMTVQEEALCLKRGGGLHPASPDWLSPAASGNTRRADHRQREERPMPGGGAPVLAHGRCFGRKPRNSTDFVVYPVPKAHRRHCLGTWVLRCLGVAHSASSPKAAQGLGSSLIPGLRVTFGRVTCMAQAASVPGLCTRGFLLFGFEFCLDPTIAGWGLWRVTKSYFSYWDAFWNYSFSNSVLF